MAHKSHKLGNALCELRSSNHNSKASVVRHAQTWIPCVPHGCSCSRQEGTKFGSDLDFALASYARKPSSNLGRATKYGLMVELADTTDLGSVFWGFDSPLGYQMSGNSCEKSAWRLKCRQPQQIRSIRIMVILVFYIH